eukprot:GHVS01098192.1.p1 GENE.GHVS01098192.1~~GHVS01098192.1.p1  ORF type:complete len:326 (-),score=98.83 GHVS01098192.1:305-1282(-)
MSFSLDIYSCAVVVVAIIVGGVSYLWLRRQNITTATATATAAATVGAAVGSEVRETRRRTAGRNDQQEETAEDVGDDQRTEQTQPTGDDRRSRQAVDSSKSQKKKAEKEMKKEEKKGIREFQQSERERKLGQLSAKEEALKKRQQEKENILISQEEAANKALEQRRAKEEETYNKWKGMFAVEGEGESSSAKDAEGEGLLLTRFVNYVMLRKTAEVEEIAAEFDMKTPEVINRLQELEKCGRLTGIFDERGKFIYITPEEMSEVAQFLQAKGRITISTDLVAACNRIIRLAPTDEGKEKIQAENRKALDVLTEVLLDSEEAEETK